MTSSSHEFLPLFPVFSYSFKWSIRIFHNGQNLLDSQRRAQVGNQSHTHAGTNPWHLSLDSLHPNNAKKYTIVRQSLAQWIRKCHESNQYGFKQQQQQFYGPLSGTTRESWYHKKHLPTHHPDHHPIFISFFHLPQSIASFLFKLRAWQSFSTTSVHVLFGLPLGLEPSTSYSYISSPNQCLLFETHAYTIATCFAVVSILYHLFLVFQYDFKMPAKLYPADLWTSGNDKKI